MQFHCRDVHVRCLATVNFLSSLLLPALLQQRIDGRVAARGAEMTLSKPKWQSSNFARFCGRIILFNGTVLILDNSARVPWLCSSSLPVYTSLSAPSKERILTRWFED